MNEAERLFARILHRVLKPLPTGMRLRRPAHKQGKPKSKRRPKKADNKRM